MGLGPFSGSRKNSGNYWNYMKNNPIPLKIKEFLVCFENLVLWPYRRFQHRQGKSFWLGLSNEQIESKSELLVEKLLKYNICEIWLIMFLKMGSKLPSKGKVLYLSKSYPTTFLKIQN